MLQDYPFNPCTDCANAYRLAEAVRGLAYYVPAWKTWVIWDGRRWARDDLGEIMSHCKMTADDIFQEAAAAADKELKASLAHWAVKSHARERLEAMEKLARSETGTALRPAVFDRNPWLISCINGIVDLRTGKFTRHILDRPDEHFITKLAPVEYDPAATAPRWERFVGEIMGKNDGLVGFLRRAAGYSLTGDCREECLFLLYGTGCNGKSKFLSAVQGAIGEYARTTAPETFLIGRSGGAIRNDIAALAGSRFVSTIETEQNRQVAEALIKWMTGRDRIAARFLYQEFFEFAPTFKVWIATNHKPDVRGTDDAIWRRIYLVPFLEKFDGARQDKDLDRKLEVERQGILAWIVRGALEWTELGLDPPAEVLAATKEYRAEQDRIGEFIAERCTVLDAASATAGDLYAEYRRYCEEVGDREAMAQNTFGAALKNRGFLPDKERGTSKRFWRGIGLLNGAARRTGEPGAGS